jgi:hypothetical protein
VLPSINTLVRVAVGHSEDPADGLRACDVPSRVEDVQVVPGAPADGPRRVLVATPRFPGDSEEPGAGTACTLTWTLPDGVVELPVAYDSSTVWNAEPTVLRLWWLAVTGEPVRIQRREYFRCPIALPVTLVPGLTGRTTDLGEGGLRCLLVGDPLEAGASVESRLELPGGSTLTVAGTVLRSDQALRAPDHADTVVRFDDPEAAGDEVRRVIFAEQLRLRRLGLG